MVKFPESVFVSLLIFFISEKCECQFYSPGFIINSNCGDIEASDWNTKNIGFNLKEWIKSIQTVIPSSDSHMLHSNITYKLLKDYNNNILLHISAVDCKTKQNVGKIWQIAGGANTSVDRQFNNGFFYLFGNKKGKVL